MLNSNKNALGILFPNSYDSLVPKLVHDRSMASIPFGGRYRLVDFILSSMVNCGIDNISLLVRQNYHSLMDHLGSGREWDLSRKNGGLNLVPPFSGKTVSVYNGRIEALASILSFLSKQKEKYVIVADTNIVVNFDFNALIDEHIASGADVSIAYTRQELPKTCTNQDAIHKEMYYTFDIGEGGRITDITLNSSEPGMQNFSMNILVVDRQLLMQQVREAYKQGHIYYERDVLLPNLDKLNVHGFLYDGYYARIDSLNNYFYENMKLLDDRNIDALFRSDSPIYTKIRDDNPTRYINGANVQNALVADGCVIEGTVENCILFRGVHIKPGAIVKNCILMQDTVVEENVCMDYIVTDKNVLITKDKQLSGNEAYPVFISKGTIV